MTDQLSIDRAANFARFGALLGAFSERMEAKGVVAVAAAAREASSLALRASAAYAAGDKTAASAARAEYTAHLAAHPTLNGIA